MTFTLHPQLEKDTLPVGDLALCRVLLMNNQQFPWLILAPRRDNIRELFELSKTDYQTCVDEMRFVLEQFAALTNADKMNMAALGNMVPQLHIHIIARYKTDAAWPNPVWNSGVSSLPYQATEAERWIHTLRDHLNITKM